VVGLNRWIGPNHPPLINGSPTTIKMEPFTDSIALKMTTHYHKNGQYNRRVSECS
jgi:hypothetical protein